MNGEQISEDWSYCLRAALGIVDQGTATVPLLKNIACSNTAAGNPDSAIASILQSAFLIESELDATYTLFGAAEIKGATCRRDDRIALR